ncbi:MAG: dockerin type I repeat-containing protein [Candidatus Wolfebacteria bacterium]|nr:dockerin type I repeat-containing protein [Candidatus Wolfebacteria bacterium]
MNTKRILLVCIGFILVFFSALKASADSVNITASVNSVCGNGILENGEQCDGTAFGGASCVSQGFSGGTLSCAASCTFNTSQCTSAPPPSGGGGGGGGGGYVAPVTSAIFNGRAYPKSTVTLLKDAQIAATTIAGADANFQISVSGLSGGNYIFSVYSEDSKGNRSSLLTFPVSVTSGATTKVSGIFIAPTITVDKSEVKRGDDIAIFGQSVPNSEITISVNSDEEFFNKIKADAGGVYLYNFDTSPLEIAQHFTKSKTALNGEISSFSKTISFAVGTKNVAKVTQEFLKGDLNNDGRVNLVDFSIVAYWYKRPSPPASADLNGDGKTDLVDFSIMAFYWTG